MISPKIFMCFALAIIFILYLNYGHGWIQVETQVFGSFRMGMMKTTSVTTQMDRYCGCIAVPLQHDTIVSKCGDTATARGPDQKVISFSFYGNSSVYIKGVQVNLDKIRQLYPGYVMRLYTNVDRRTNPDHHRELCQINCANGDIFDICDVNNHDLLGDMADSFGMTWRFAPMADPLVKEWHSRDLDSIISQREVAAVKEFVRFNKTFHLMRDNPYHGLFFLGGAFGMKFDHGWDTKRTEFAEKFDHIIKRSVGIHQLGWDQSLLQEHLRNMAEGDLIAHDSYSCRHFTQHRGNRDPYHRAFPTKRLKGKNNFVGSNGGELTKENGICPELCRPEDHQDWTLC